MAISTRASEDRRGERRMPGQTVPATGLTRAACLAVTVLFLLAGLVLPGAVAPVVPGSAVAEAQVEAPATGSAGNDAAAAAPEHRQAVVPRSLVRRGVHALSDAPRRAAAHARPPARAPPLAKG
jgi:hypothetical protein